MQSECAAASRWYRFLRDCSEAVSLPAMWLSLRSSPDRIYSSDTVKQARGLRWSELLRQSQSAGSSAPASASRKEATGSADHAAASCWPRQQRPVYRAKGQKKDATRRPHSAWSYCPHRRVQRANIGHLSCTGPFIQGSSAIPRWESAEEARSSGLGVQGRALVTLASK